jgi:hypothetical protein
MLKKQRRMAGAGGDEGAVADGFYGLLCSWISYLPTWQRLRPKTLLVHPRYF